MPRLFALACPFWFLITAACFAQPAAAEKSAVDPFLIVDRFKFSLADGAVMLPVQVGSRACRFMLDTGATTSVVDKSLIASDAKAAKKGFNESTKEPVELFEMPAGKLGESPLRRAAPVVAAVDLSKVSEMAGYEVAGVLGFDFFVNRVVQIDFDREEVLILNKVPVKCGEKIKIAYKTPNRPTARVKVSESRTDDFLIDTGAVGFDSGSLKPNLAEKLLADASGRVVGHALQQTIVGANSMRLVQTRQITLGELTTPQPVFGEGGENLLSLNYLSRYCVTFDLGHGRVYLKEGKRFLQPDFVDRSGLHIVRRESQAMIHSVDTGSAAANAGLAPGDRILFVGDIRGDTGPLHVMRGILCAPDATVPIAIRRAEKEFTVSLRLAPATLEPSK